jgi:hypothetical protein
MKINSKVQKTPTVKKINAELDHLDNCVSCDFLTQITLKQEVRIQK